MTKKKKISTKKKKTATSPQKKSEKNNYIDNAKFLKEISIYRRAFRKAKREGQPRPKLPEYIGECFLLIAENFSHNHKFLYYTFRDEMIADSVENCVRYAHSFNPAKSSNPFAYFTRTVYHAFIRRIRSEKDHLYAKYKSAEYSGLIDEHHQMETSDGVSRQFETYENIGEFIEKYEAAREAKKQKKIQKAKEKELG